MRSLSLVLSFAFVSTPLTWAANIQQYDSTSCSFGGVCPVDINSAGFTVRLNGTSAHTGTTYTDIALSSSATAFIAGGAPDSSVDVRSVRAFEQGFAFEGLNGPALIHIPVSVNGAFDATGGLTATAHFVATMYQPRLPITPGSFDYVRTTANSTERTFVAEIPDPDYGAYHLYAALLVVLTGRSGNAQAEIAYELTLDQARFTDLSGNAIPGVQMIPVERDLGGVPEPGSGFLMIVGMGFLALRRNAVREAVVGRSFARHGLQPFRWPKSSPSRLLAERR